MRKKLQNVDEKLDWLIGEYKKFEEEHTLVVNRVSDHNDRLEALEKKVGIVI